jgi:nucleoside-diphosphate-sugar epimerase
MKDLNVTIEAREVRASDKIVVVTGGSGFIGGACVKLLNDDPSVAEIRILDVSFPDYELSSKMRFLRCDVNDLSALLKYSVDADEWIDNVGMLGTGDKHELGAYPVATLQTNVAGFVNQLEAAYINRVPKFFHQSKNRFDERDGTPFGLSENWYTATKSMAEIAAFWARKSRGQQITVVRYLNASGHRQHLGFVRKLFPLAVVSAILDIDFTVYGDGQQLADFIHVEDLASAALTFMRSDNKDAPVRMLDIGTGQAISVIDLVTKIKAAVGSSSHVQHLPMRHGEKPNTRITAASEDIEEARSYGWECKFTEDDVIRDYVDYYLTGEIDYTYVFNTLVYFQDTYNRFQSHGRPIDIRTLGVAGIRKLFAEKRANYIKDAE